MTLVKMSDTHPTNHDLRNIKVLVVDDDPIIRKFLEMTLNDLHVHSIRSCADGFSALKAMAGYAPSVILTDIHMKPINGFEFVRRLRADINPFRRDIPVIFLSSDSSPETLKGALPLHASGYIVKPPCAETLRAKLVQAMHPHK